MTLGKSALSDFSLGFLGFLCFLGFFCLLGGPSTKVTPAKGHSSLAPKKNLPCLRFYPNLPVVQAKSHFSVEDSVFPSRDHRDH